ncbi:MAG: hypothetical protein IKS27_06895 [Oscillospiraceae bacterium]|nr:hypothetical protein [Oscillospiraceae bacterium]
MSDAREKYSDIIDLPHHVSPSRPQMPLQNRAAQFSPFAALTGYEELIEESARMTEQYRTPDETALEELNAKMVCLRRILDQRPEVTVTYFKPDDWKAGGAYLEKTGQLALIDPQERVIAFSDGFAVDMDYISEIRSDALNGLL